MTSEIVPSEQVYLGSLALAPEAVVYRAAKIATVLADVIRKRHLSKKIGPSEHVLVEGWATLGALVGVSPKEREVHHTIDGEIHEVVYHEPVRPGCEIFFHSEDRKRVEGKEAA